MDLLLVLEHRFYKDKDNSIWCDRVVNREFIERYLSVFDNITICARVNTTTKINDGFYKVSGERTYFLELPDFTGFKQMLSRLPRIISIFKREYKKYSIIIFRAPSPISLLLYRFCIGKVKIGVEFVMGADKFFSYRNLIGNFLNKIAISEAKNLCIKANAVSYVTAQQLQRIYPSYSIKYGEDSKHIDSYYSSVNLKDYNFVERNWSVDNKPDQYRIAHIGYMDSDRKGHEILIEALSQVKNKGLDVELYFVGDGKMRNYFEEVAKKLRVNDSVIFHGATNDKKEIIDILSKSHLFVLPSKSEGLPRVIIEAMATSTPCIASGVDGTPELLDENCIVNSFISNDYANKIIEFLENWEMMINYSNLNYEKAKLFHENVLNDKRTNFYNKLKKMDG